MAHGHAWRAGCGETRTSGSERGMKKPTPATGQGASSLLYLKTPPPSHSTVPPQTPPARFRVRCPIPGANPMTSRGRGLAPVSDRLTWWNLAGSHRRGCGWGASPLLRKKWRISRSAAEAIRQPRDRLKRQPQERQHSAAVFGGTRDRLPPARGAVSCVRDRSPSGPKPPLGGFGSREPGPL